MLASGHLLYAGLLPQTSGPVSKSYRRCFSGVSCTRSNGFQSPCKGRPSTEERGEPSRPTCMVLRYSSPGLQEAPRSHEQGEACPEWPPCPCPALLCPLPGSVSHRSVNPGPVSLCLLLFLFVLHLQSSLALLFGSPTELRSLVRGCAGDLQADISEPAGFWHRVRRCQAGDSKLQDYTKMVNGPWTETCEKSLGGSSTHGIRNTKSCPAHGQSHVTVNS